jgi:hypothetical protein
MINQNKSRDQFWGIWLANTSHVIQFGLYWSRDRVNLMWLAKTCQVTKYEQSDWPTQAIDQV